MSATDKFLDAIEGTRIPYVEVTDAAQNPYCDSCSEPVRPNRDIQLYGVNKLIDGRVISSGFRVLRLHCEDCTLPQLYLPCEGYSEYLIDATVDTDWRIHDPDIRDVSPDSEGTPWDPKGIFEDLFGMPYEQLLAVTGYESQGPLDVLDTLSLLGIDPREVIHDDGSHTVTDDHRERLAEEGGRIMAKREDGDAPPQPSAVEKLKAYLATEDPEE